MQNIPFAIRISRHAEISVIFWRSALIIIIIIHRYCRQWNAMQYGTILTGTASRFHSTEIFPMHNRITVKMQQDKPYPITWMN